jgi:hypothetical protein
MRRFSLLGALVAAVGLGGGCARAVKAPIVSSGTLATDPVLALRTYQLECDGGNVLGCILLGRMYAEGIGVDPDDRLAALAFEKSCRLGPEGACGAAGLYYENGFGVERDEAKAAELYERGCGESAGTCANLGYLYENEI